MKVKTGKTRRIVNVERGVNKEMESMFREYEHIIETNKEMQKELVSRKEENEILKYKCVNYGVQFEDLKGKVKDDL